MEIYLVRHGQSDAHHAMDPYSAVLTPWGREQAERIAARCEAWGVDLLCTSTMLRALETADAVSARLPDTERWDLDQLEDLTVDDLMGEPSAGHLVSTWSQDQLHTAREQAWNRIMAAITRIGLYAESKGLSSVVIIGHHSTINLLLLSWLGLDWRAADRLDVAVDHGSTCRLTLEEGRGPRIDWINRLP